MIRRWLVALLVSCVLVPTLAAARPACCVKFQSPKRPACCASMTASAPKGCCKAPAVPRPEARAKDTLAGLALAMAGASCRPAAVAATVTPAEAARLARRSHRSASPDDSPPDLLSLHPALLI